MIDDWLYVCMCAYMGMCLDVRVHPQSRWGPFTTANIYPLRRRSIYGGRRRFASPESALFFCFFFVLFCGSRDRAPNFRGLNRLMQMRCLCSVSIQCCTLALLSFRRATAQTALARTLSSHSLTEGVNHWTAHLIASSTFFSSAMTKTTCRIRKEWNCCVIMTMTTLEIRIFLTKRRTVRGRRRKFSSRRRDEEFATACACFLFRQHWEAAALSPSFVHCLL